MIYIDHCFHILKVELGSKAGTLKQMLLDLLEDPHEIRRICIMGRNCTVRRGTSYMECSIPLDKQIVTEEEEEEEIEMLLENYLQSRVELLLQVGTFCVSVGALVAGIFGMNLKSHFEEKMVYNS
ncbi:hypothetical protein B296_00003590 [Ensete ventricosum]|uniref:Magnesium transporter n=1 Tax=Ensete ventricosum TaxID=4639 RepID=A0A427ALS6_ENSVE|nr:hypothetical protein B296_00003590 [Ensete ventricosum]